MSIADRIRIIQGGIDAALVKRKEQGLETVTVKLVAVTKNQTVSSMQEAIDAGAYCIGENRVQEALNKQKTLGGSLEWHLIGHLQTNKARQAVAAFDLIHSVDSERLANEINQAAARIGKKQMVLLQVNIAGEVTKFGLETKQVFQMTEKLMAMPNISLAGIMTIAPYCENPEDVRPVFREMYRLFTELRLQYGSDTMRWLSMGMTNDYQVAIEEGSNLVRIGTAIFGPRQY